MAEGDPACLIERAQYPGEAVLSRAIELAWAAAVEKRWILFGGWAYHLYMKSVDGKGIYADESRLCSSGDLDVMCEDPWGDLCALARKIFESTGSFCQVASGRKDSSFSLKVGLGGPTLIDAIRAPPAVLAVVPRVTVQRDRGTAVAVLHPHVVLAMLYGTLSNPFTFGPKTVMPERRAKLAQRIAALERASMPPPRASTTFDGKLQDAAAARIAVLEACRNQPYAVLTGVAAWELVSSTKGLTAPIDVVAHEPAFAELAFRLCAAVPAIATCVVRQTSGLPFDPSYEGLLEMYTADGALVARLLMLLVPAPCIEVAEFRIAPHAELVPHLMWTHVLDACVGRPDLSRLEYATFRDMYAARSKMMQSFPDFYEIRYARDRFCGKMPFKGLSHKKLTNMLLKQVVKLKYFVPDKSGAVLPVPPAVYPTCDVACVLKTVALTPEMRRDQKAFLEALSTLSRG
jgi:hypothetical protein